MQAVFIISVVMLTVVGLSFWRVRQARLHNAGAGPDTAGAQLPMQNSYLSAATALVGGLLLVGLAQWAQPALPPLSQRRLLWLIGYAALILAWGGLTVTVRGPGAWLDWLGRPLSLRRAQVLLLLLAPGFALLTRLAAGDQQIAHIAAVANISWLLALLLLVLGSWQFGTKRPSISRRDLLLTAALFVFAMLVRSLGLSQIPTTMSGDEGGAGLMAVRFLEGEANNLFALGWFSFPALYFEVQSWAIQLFGRTLAAVRWPSALAGGMAVVGLYWLARALFDRKTAVIAAAYLAASHYHIHMSRLGLNNIWDSFFAVMALFGFWDGWKNGRRRSFILCGLALGIGQYFYVSMRVVPLLLLVWTAIAFLVERQTVRARLPQLSLAAFIALTVYLPLALFFLKFPDEFFAPLNRVTLFGEWMAYLMRVEQLTETAVLLRQIRLAMLGFTHEPLRLFYEPNQPLLLPFAALLFLLGLLWLVHRFDLRALLIALPLLMSVISSSLSRSPPAAQRYVLASPFVALVLALAVVQIAGWLARRWPGWRRVVWSGTAVTMIIIMTTDLNFYFREVYRYFVLGGLNTAVATEMAYYLEDQTDAASKVYFLGAPRMTYHGFSSLAYLVPEVEAEDVLAPLTAVPALTPATTTIFIVLPERLPELTPIREAYPNGTLAEIWSQRGDYLFVAYAVE